jgi:hypothetical protein
MSLVSRSFPHLERGQGSLLMCGEKQAGWEERLQGTMLVRKGSQEMGYILESWGSSTDGIGGNAISHRVREWKEQTLHDAEWQGTPCG